MITARVVKYKYSCKIFTMVDNFGQKLSILIEKLNLNANVFATEIGLSSQAIYNMLGPRQSKPSYEFFEKLAERYPHIDFNYFFKDDYTKYDLNDTLSVVSEPAIAYGASPGKIPVLSHRTAANSLMGIEANEPIDVTGYLEMPKEIVGNGVLVALPVRGNSMSPVIPNGGYVIIRLMDRGEWDNIRNGRIYMVNSQLYGSQTKYVRRSERQPSLLLLESENLEHDMITIDISEINQIWELKASLHLTWSSLKKGFFERLDRIEQGYLELALQVNNLKQPKQITTHK